MVIFKCPRKKINVDIRFKPSSKKIYSLQSVKCLSTPCFYINNPFLTLAPKIV